jgi:hypothetical protein
VDPFCEIDSFSDPEVTEAVSPASETAVIEEPALTPVKKAASAAANVADGPPIEPGPASLENTQLSSAATSSWTPPRLAAALCIVVVVAIGLGNAIRDAVRAPEPVPRGAHITHDRHHHQHRRGKPSAVAIAQSVPPRIYDPGRPAANADATAPAPANGPSAARERPAHPSNVGSRGQFAYLGD